MRRRAIRTILAALIALIAAFSAQPAEAQGWLADRDSTRGPGFEVGALSLHPGFGMEVGWDSNVYLEDAAPEDRFLMRLTAHLRATTRQAEENPRVVFDGGVDGSFYHFFGASGRDNVAAGADLSVHIRPGASVSFRLGTDLRRRIRPFVDGLPSLRYGRLTNTTDAELNFQTEGGVLKGRIGYRLGVDYFEDPEFSYAMNFAHTIRTGIYWAFLPHTGFVYEGDVTRVSFNRADRDPSSLVSDGWRVRQEVGLNGVLTRGLSLTAMAGYSAGFFQAGDDYGTGADALTLRLEGRFRPRNNLDFQLGYQRLYNPSFLGNYARHDRVYAGGRWVLGGSFLLSVDVGVVRSVTGTVFASDGTSVVATQPRRQAWRITGRIYTEYRFTDWLALSAELDYLHDLVDGGFTYAVPGVTFVDPGASFSKFQAWLGLRVFY